MGGGIKKAGDGQTPLSDLSDLLQSHITTQEELNRAEFANINQVLTKYLIKKPSTRKAPFNYAWFLKLHREMFADVWQWAGCLRKTGMNIGVPPLKIAQEIHRMQRDLSQWKTEVRDPDVIAAHLHHRLVWIHPFPGGNGRWARMTSNIYLKQASRPIVEWPEEQILAPGGFRDQYLAALKTGDLGDLTLLEKLHRLYQRQPVKTNLRGS